ncbi:MAG: S1C family serine protease [Planctomycetota bacterium]
MRRSAATWLLACLAGAAPAGAAEGERARSQAAAQAAARVRPSVVTIRALGKGRDGYGAGVVVNESGVVLTALHVVHGASALAIVTEEGQEHPGKLLAIDQATDLALVRTVAPGSSFAPVVFARDDDVAVGETLLAVSNPFGLGISVSRGVLSARGRRNVVGHNAASLLQTDAAINPGSSGGVLVNLEGEVVGLIVAILTRTGGHQGVGFAVPAHELRRVVRSLLRGEPVRRPWLGVRVAPAEAGLKIMSVVPGGPAAHAGLRPGDTLVSLKGRRLERVRDLRRLLREVRVGALLRADYLRDGKGDAVEVEVGARPPPAQKSPARS